MMKFIQCIFVSLLTTQVFSYGLNNRIVGSNVKLESVPFQVALTRARSDVWGVPDHLKLDIYCGGSIINESWILTAAYCVYGIPTTSANTINVLAGTYNLTDMSNQQIRSVISSIMYHSYPGLHAQHDIALLKLNEPLVLNKYVKAISLPKSEANYDSLVYVSGWGLTSTTKIENMSNVLGYGLVLTIYYDKCNNIMKQMNVKFEVFDTQLCTGPANRIISTCIGDSGSPLFRKINSDTWEQIGIVSWGLYPCGSNNISSVYTRVSHYVGWINNIISSM